MSQLYLNVSCEILRIPYTMAARYQNGNPLWQETRTGDGDLRKNDNIKNAYERLRRELGIKQSLKSLKKTSASLIRDNERFRGLEGLFLGHAPRSMFYKHYTTVPRATFDEAVLC